MKFSALQKLNISILVLAICIIFTPKLSFAGSLPSTFVIDEFMVTGPKGEPATSEYVVLANYGTEGVVLDGYFLSRRVNPDDTSNTLFNKFVDFTLAPGKRIIVAHNDYSGLRDFNYSTSSYSLSSNHTILLIAPDGKTVIDMVELGKSSPITNPFPAPLAGQVYARINGADTGIYTEDFKLQGVDELVTKDTNADKLIISELLPSPSTGEEWFELYNPTNLTISLMNLKICDVMGSTHCYHFGENDVLSANSYKTYLQSMTKITMNNSGDWLELYDLSDNLITDSGGNYVEADKGISLSLFGNEYRWTKTPTPATENIFNDIIEIEDEPVVKAKKTKSKVVTATKKNVITSTSDEGETPATDEAEVMAAETTNPVVAVKKAFINNKVLGWGLIGLAILLLLSYTLWYFRDYAKNIYDKIRHRDDSARF